MLRAPRPGDLPAAWFGRLPEHASSSTAAAWRRVARDLPAHLAAASPSLDLGVRVHGVRVDGVRVDGVGVAFGAGIGLSDTAGARLRPFEGLKEGFAPLA